MPHRGVEHVAVLVRPADKCVAVARGRNRGKLGVVRYVLRLVVDWFATVDVKRSRVHVGCKHSHKLHVVVQAIGESCRLCACRQRRNSDAAYADAVGKHIGIPPLKGVADLGGGFGSGQVGLLLYGGFRAVYFAVGVVTVCAVSQTIDVQVVHHVVLLAVPHGDVGNVVPFYKGHVFGFDNLFALDVARQRPGATVAYLHGAGQRDRTTR